MWHLCMRSLWIMSQLFIHNLWIMCQLCIHSLWIMCQLCVHSLWIIWQLRSNPKKNMVNGEWNSMPELTITSPYVHSGVDSNTFTMGNPMPESTCTHCQCRLYPPVRDFEFGLCLFTACGWRQTCIHSLWIM